MRRNTKQKKQKQNHQVKFFTTEQTKVGRRGPIIIVFR